MICSECQEPAPTNPCRLCATPYPLPTDSAMIERFNGLFNVPIMRWWNVHFHRFIPFSLATGRGVPVTSDPVAVFLVRAVSAEAAESQALHETELVDGVFIVIGEAHLTKEVVRLW